VARKIKNLRARSVRPGLLKIDGGNRVSVVATSHPELGEGFLYCERSVPLLFTENETNSERIFGTTNRTPYVKDSINNFLVHQQSAGVNPSGTHRNALRKDFCFPLETLHARWDNRGVELIGFVQINIGKLNAVVTLRRSPHLILRYRLPVRNLSGGAP
jgi:hypothetical protein